MVDQWFNCKEPKFIFSGTDILKHVTPDIVSSREHLESIFLTFKNIDAKTFNNLYSGLRKCFRSIFFQYEDLYEEYILKYGQTHATNPREKVLLIMEEFVSFLEYLSLKKEKKFVILIDEYDKVLMDAANKEEETVNGYFDNVLDIYRNFLNSLLKDTPFVEKGRF